MPGLLPFFLLSLIVGRESLTAESILFPFRLTLRQLLIENGVPFRAENPGP